MVYRKRFFFSIYRVSNTASGFTEAKYFYAVLSVSASINECVCVRRFYILIGWVDTASKVRRVAKKNNEACCVNGRRGENILNIPRVSKNLYVIILGMIWRNFQKIRWICLPRYPSQNAYIHTFNSFSQNRIKCQIFIVHKGYRKWLAPRM